MHTNDILKSAESYMTTFHTSDSTGHDVAHIKRVVNMAKYIANKENDGDLLIIELACLLHDTIDEKLTDGKQAKIKLLEFLNQLALSSHQQADILHIIENMSYQDGQNNSVQLSIEGQIVRDADRLDAIGAIGIARTFQFAGHFNEPMWVDIQPDAPSNHETTDYIDWSPSAIKHFYEKLFKLKDLMHTETGKRIAQQRHEYMKGFVNQFFKEWYV
ncbi:phosphohydrolase [Staphylococcus succinus]|uniref:HD domain-containing protein n=1 Tax=Staphylococcus succinus TaxID=61015 RepID=UPI000C33F8E6|nr:HD domain-containing protein [Staphylococcus succinus]MBU0439239.1 HD domain-containing protein [Staphylococcus succinus]MEB7463480.1 HD domain-containing protein [Staphylococcus succinus]PKI20586.1 phosphohydrolase [Staphylococcus succinus]PTI48600.1 HD domain-containing protein [Staphylococcus succinus]PTJ84561.1 HD domain-containing protein [Staphylococcus succinus]